MAKSGIRLNGKGESPKLDESAKSQDWSVLYDAGNILKLGLGERTQLSG